VTVATKPAKKKNKRPSRDSLEIISKAYDATRGRAGETGNPEDLAVKSVVSAVRASLELGPTLVVWVIDRTPSAQRLVSSTTVSAKAMYDDAEIRQLASAGQQQLLTAVVAFDDNAEFVLDPPSAEPSEAQAALDKVQPSSGGREMPFTAVRQALEKYLAFRADPAQRREIVIVVITDEAGDDANLADSLAAIVQRHAVPIYCLGLPAPWGQANPFATDPKKGDPTRSDDSIPVYGPESLVSERVELEMPRSSSGNLDLIDSGFGPFPLERLCRAGGGKFLAIRPDEVSQYKYSNSSAGQWPSGSEIRFEVENLGKYAPEYVSAEEHQRLLEQSKTRQALVRAAALARLRIDGSPDTRFPKAAEAQMKRTLDRAQQYAAKNQPGIDKVYEVLAAGEADREKLTSPRIAAQFDLAIGRVLATKARMEGYNSMIAALKRGKTFASESSTTWNLEAADAYETESTIKKLAERAKKYLERVVQEHPGTPWAKIAEAELAMPMGWTWKES
jgi:hypothetical protein